MSRSIVDTPVADPVVTVERVFDAPRALLFRLFTDPLHLARFYGPHGATNTISEMDVRPGGLWRQVMRLRDGSEYLITSIYLDVVEPERIVFRNVPEECGFDGLPAPRLVTTILFEDLNGRTRLTAEFRAVSIAERDEIVAWGIARNMSQGNEKLAAYITRLRSAG